MSWVHFYWLWILVPILVLMGLGFFLIQKNEIRIGSWIDRSFWREVMPGFIPRRGNVIHALLGCSVLFAVLALARPQWGAEEEWLDNTGSDIALVLDVSNSMLAEDSAPSRLARAKLMIRRLTRELGQDRVAIVIFAGTSALVAPFTSDSAYLDTVLDIVEPQAIQNQGTNIELALETAIDAFQRIGSPEGMHRSIVLITDGEDFGSSAKAFIEKAIKDKFIFFAIGVGTEEGAPVPLRTENGSLLTYKKDGSGKPVVSKLNRKDLVALTQAGRGEYLDLTSPDAVAGTVLKSMDRTKRQDALRKVTRKIERFQYPLLLAILFLIAALLLRRNQKEVARIAFTLLLLLVNQESSAGTLGALDRYIHEQSAERRIQAKDLEGAKKDLEASLEPDSPETAYNLGTVLSTEEDPEDRHKKLLEESAREALKIGDYDTAASAEYNLGSKSLDRKKHDEAIPHLLDAIEIARRGGNSALEKVARQQLAQAIEQKKQQQQQKQQDQQDPKDQKEDQAKKDQDQDQKQLQQANNGREPKPKPFKSDSLTREAAEGIMRQLADNEKRLQMKQLQSKTRKQEKDQRGQDW